MSTIKQQNLARTLAQIKAEHRNETLKSLLESVGYALSTSEDRAKYVITSKGVQDELRKLGFNREAAESVISEILMTGEERNKLEAAKEIFKVTGAYAPTKSINVNFFSELSKEIESNGNSLSTDIGRRSNEGEVDG